MRKSTLGKIVLSLVVVGVSFVSCVKDDPASLIPPPVPDQSFTEEFDTVAQSFKRGWVPINNSNPKGSGIWAQGGGLLPIFAPYSSKGTYPGFIGADYTSTSGTDDVISNWLISPVVTMQNGDKIVFYTRTQLLQNFSVSGDSTDYGNNLEVCINTKNTGTNVGTAYDPKSASYNISTDRGDFSLALSINPPVYDNANKFWTYKESHSLPSLFDPLAYPSRWTRFEVTIGGLNGPTKGRFAFRYYTLDAGSNGNGSAIGIDQVSYISKK
ncbi:MAG: choice-of-anchor J domain-containing protein [Chitinophagaceae bacterium]|uniref:choice-of-anchor J domain-containing protein n=1 Tax=unclassified Paraflavitalea TaxID=2798305 RepID=UPI003D3581EC|nr:choice-of-anchor J domain-containing protein [Chitinophagaceae bacterium]